MTGKCSIAAALAASVFSSAAFGTVLVNPSFYGQANTTYQEWDGFTSPAGPNAPTLVSNSNGTPNWLDTTNATDGAFAIGSAGSAHIYSYAGTENLQADVPTPTNVATGAVTTVVLQTEVVGNGLDAAMFGITYPGLTGSPILPTSINETDVGSSGSGFGGGDYYDIAEWDNLPVEPSYSIDYSPGTTSSSQESARVDTLTAAPVPEPMSIGIVGAGGLLSLRRRARRTK